MSRRSAWRFRRPRSGAGGGGGGSAQVHGFAARALGIRVYAIATPAGYRVMPGGLARIAADTADIVSMQRGGGSKDVWVLAADRQLDRRGDAASPAAMRRTRRGGAPR